MTSSTSESKITMWVPDPLSQEVEKSLQKLLRSDDVQRVAVMPDIHLGKAVCNGTVLATKELLYPVAVGADIGCGMLAVSFDLDVKAISGEREAGQLLAGLYQRIPSIKHGRSTHPDSLPAVFDEISLSSPFLEKQKKRDGLFQLGTLGRGNHFVELQSDVDGRLWLMLHSGSRGMGQIITDFHLRSARISRTGLCFIDATTSAGQAYVSDVNWAVEYAMQNRLEMARAVESLMRDLFGVLADWSTLIHCQHNHLRREYHFGEAFWIHRKGALPASDQEPGVIPGSMGSSSYHVTGRGNDLSLRSSSHGAGRLFARNAARNRISSRDLQRQMQGIWFDQRHTEGLRDEAPAAYKDICRVMRAQRDLTRIIRQLCPVLVYKGN